MYTKKNTTRHIRIIKCMLVVLCIVSGLSCKKYLDKKPRQSLAVPGNLNDLQIILDNQKANISPGYLELVSDDYYVLSNTWNSASVDQRLNYIWAPDAKIVNEDYVWTDPYAAIYESNFVLDLLPGVDKTESGNTTYNSIKGTALFYRAFEFYQLAQLFCKPYSVSAATDPGIVLKLNADVNEHYTRSTVQQVYDQVTADLKSAAELLPVTTLFSTRPDKASAYGMLSRVYLSMRDYTNAAVYVNLALAIKNTLLDYNSLTPAGNPVLPPLYLNNSEVIFESHGGSSLLEFPRSIIDSTLYASYGTNDLRKIVFFGSYGNNTYYFKGSYFSASQLSTPFLGIATDELYLIRAECRARAGDKTGALQDLNTLLRKRWRTGFFTDINATDAPDALAKVLVERRKELVFRGVRWSDLRRFNLENAGITLKRIINTTTYTLPPNDNRWVLPIPEKEVSRSGIQQNPR